MNIQLKTKRALVTASTGGIGFAVAKGLAEAGAAVVVNGRSEGSVNAAVARLLAEVPGASVIGVAADLSTAPGVASLLAGISDIDILWRFQDGPIGTCAWFGQTRSRQWCDRQ